MAKTLDEILREGRQNPAAIRELQEQAKKAGLTKRVIHIELDMLTGNLKSQATPMDHVMHLGMLEFYKVTVIGQMLARPIAKSDEPAAPAADAPAPSPAPEDAAPAADAPAPVTAEADAAAPTPETRVGDDAPAA